MMTNSSDLNKVANGTAGSPTIIVPGNKFCSKEKRFAVNSKWGKVHADKTKIITLMGDRNRVFSGKI